MNDEKRVFKKYRMKNFFLKEKKYYNEWKERKKKEYKKIFAKNYDYYFHQLYSTKAILLRETVAHFDPTVDSFVDSVDVGVSHIFYLE